MDEEQNGGEASVSPSNIGETSTNLSRLIEERETNRELLEALRGAQPSWQKSGDGLRGPTSERRRTLNDVPANAALPGSISRRSPEEDFPVEIPAAIIQVTAQANINASFRLIDVSTTSGNPPVTTNKVLVSDGRVNGIFPTGMPGGTFILTLLDPANSIIYVVVTFNPSNLAILSRDVGVWKPADGAFPLNRIPDLSTGFLYWKLGFTYFDGHGMFQVWNQRLGDINFDFEYGSVAGVKSLLPFNTDQGWLRMP